MSIPNYMYRNLNHASREMQLKIMAVCERCNWSELCLLHFQIYLSKPLSKLRLDARVGHLSRGTIFLRPRNLDNYVVVPLLHSTSSKKWTLCAHADIQTDRQILISKVLAGGQAGGWLGGQAGRYATATDRRMQSMRVVRTEGDHL
jgi:hypothetical protein